MNDDIKYIEVFKAGGKMLVSDADYEAWKKDGWLKDGDTRPKPKKKKKEAE